jgi:hypothetical protein
VFVVSSSSVVGMFLPQAALILERQEARASRARAN